MHSENFKTDFLKMASRQPSETRHIHIFFSRKVSK